MSGANDPDEIVPAIPQPVPVGPNHTVFDCPAAVSKEHRRCFREIMRELKAVHNQKIHAGFQHLHSSDWNKFLEHVFSDSWTTAKEYHAPMATNFEPSNLRVDIRIGTLANDHPNPVRRRARGAAASATGDSAASNPVISPFRRSGAPVYLRAHFQRRFTHDIVGRTGRFAFRYVDGNTRLLTGRVNFNWRRGWDDQRAYLTAMKRHDLQQYEVVGRYNLAWAVFLARGRLVRCANGEEARLSVDPYPREPFIRDVLLDTRLCRNCFNSSVLPRPARQYLEPHRQRNLTPFLS